MSSINKNQKISERKVFRINVGTISPGKAEPFLKEIISKFKKTPLIDSRDNIYVKELLTEKLKPIYTVEGLFTTGNVFYPHYSSKQIKHSEGEAVIEDYFIPTR